MQSPVLVSLAIVLLTASSCTNPPTVQRDPFGPTFRLDEAAASTGGPAAWIRFGARFETGRGVEPDLAQAKAWYRRAAEAGSAEGALALGKLLERPDLPPELREPPEPWLTQAAEAGRADAQFELAKRLAGYEKTREPASAEWLEKAVAQGYLPAMEAKARDLAGGEDAKDRQPLFDLLKRIEDRDPTTAFNIEGLAALTRAALGSNPKAPDAAIEVTPAFHEAGLSLDFEAWERPGGAYWGGVLLRRLAARPPGKYAVGDLGRDDDLTLYSSESVEELRRRAATGDVQSACNLGFLALRDQDYAAAFQSYQQAAEAGAIRAIYHLGTLYRDGHGVTADRAHAQRLFQKAAEAEYPPAEAALGDLLFTGAGTERDAEGAMAWLWPAAGYGNPLAEYDLGLAHSEGSGVARDDAKGVMWIARAAAVWYPCSHECASRNGLAAARDWLASARADPALADLITRAVAEVGGSRPEMDEMRERNDVDTADIDCLGREVNY